MFLTELIINKTHFHLKLERVSKPDAVMAPPPVKGRANLQAMA